MTDAARAAVEAWMAAQCPHEGRVTFMLSKHLCPDCLLAFAAAQRDVQTEEAYEEGRRVGERVGRAEEREACARIVDTHHSWQDAADAIRARREGPG